MAAGAEAKGASRFSDMKSAAKPSGRIYIVEYLRGLASLAVAWFHLTNGYDDNWVEATGAYGWLGVEVFFVISGFIIPYAISHTPGPWGLRCYWRFLARRVVRLEPPYIVSIGIVVILLQMSMMAPGFAGSVPDLSTPRIFAHLFYVIPLTSYAWLQPVYWTLAYEFIFYLVIGAVFPWVCAARRRVVWVSAVGGVAIGALLDVWPDRILLFVIGIAVFRQRVRGDHSALALGVVVSSICVMAYEGRVVEGVAGGATAVAIMLGLRKSVGSAVVHRGLLRLGTISYSLYLLHVPVGGRLVNLGKRIVETDLGQVGLSAAALVVSILAAVVYWRVVERPAVALARRISVNALPQPKLGRSRQPTQAAF